ncbi:large ribosomal subunit protein uL5m [Monosporozyma unispora]|nr:mitochondrial 54S ribosomal protein YmL7/YmL5 [Kazachstania unispora]
MFRNGSATTFNTSKRGFFTSTILRGKPGCALVPPVHHLVKIDKSKLSPRFPGLKYDKDDIRSPAYHPKNTHQDRVQEHYLNTLQSDMMLMNYSHEAKTEKGLKKRTWDVSKSPYHVNRPLRRPQGPEGQRPDVHPIIWNNIPSIDNVILNCYVAESRDNELLAVSALLQLQQITGCKPSIIYSKSNVPNWKIRSGRQMGAKIKLTGLPMHQFLSTLSEIVLPRIRKYRGIKLSSGDSLGNISLGLTAADVKFFPEIDANQDLWPKTFGFHITINTTAETDDRARTLISGFQLPFDLEPSKKEA